jgi:UDP-3-O-acyl-N-acetylglucosamine deacetylase
MIEKIKSGSPNKYEKNPERELFNLRQLIYYRKQNGLLHKEEYEKIKIKYKIKFYEHKIKKLKEELEK